MTKAATFLLRFQEEHPAADEEPEILASTQTVTAKQEERDQDPRGLAPVLAGTATMTKAHEDPDQDPRALGPLIAGTSTITNTVEDSDQDPQFMTTQTGTLTKETPDQHVSLSSYFAIPRAACS